MSASDKHADFTKRLTDLIVEFHKENPDLFVNDIRIHSGGQANLEWVFLGLSVEMLVQPDYARSERE